MNNMSAEIQALCAECERLATRLEQYAPNHYLTDFEMSGLTEEQEQAVQRRFFLQFGPNGMKNRLEPSPEESLIAFRTYKRLLQEALPAVLAEAEVDPPEFAVLIRVSKIALSPEDLLTLIATCEDLDETLRAYNERHELLQLSRRFLSAEHGSDEYFDKVLRRYIPNYQPTSYPPSLCDLIIAFGQYHFDLSAALAVAHAECTSRASKK